MRQEVKQHLKRYLKVLLFFIIFILILKAATSSLNLSDAMFLKLYYIFAVIIVVISITINHCYHRHYQKKMSAIVKLLENNETDKYIELIKQLQEKTKSRYIKSLCTLNLSVGYSDKKEYAKAIELLESISNNRMYNDVKMCYWLNLCCNYYYLNEIEKAKEIYSKSLKFFKPFRKTPLYGGNIAVLDMFMELENKNYELVAELLEIAKLKWTNPRLQEDFLFIENALSSHMPLVQDNIPK